MTEENASSLSTTQHRRTLISIGALAMAAGSGLAWWRYSIKSDAPSLKPLWTAEFEQPDGSILRLADFKGRALVVNFWATWCTPCVEEMPLLNAFFQENKSKSWQVLGLAIDQPSAVKRFLTQNPVEYPVGLAGLNGTELMTALGNQAGGLPFTLVVNPQGGLLFRKLGKLSGSDISAWL